MKLGMFVYDFPHRKSVDFLLSMKYNNIKLDCVFGAPWVKLNSNELVRTRVRGFSPFHPHKVCDILGFDYNVVVHNSVECRKLISYYDLDVGIIAGARILSKNVIGCFKTGIINFHPGSLPENRGLYNVAKACISKYKQCVTAHLIDEHIDSGVVLDSEVLIPDCDDTVFDIENKLYDMQVIMLPRILKLLEEKK